MKHTPGPHQDVKKIWFEVQDFIRKELKEHRKNWDPSDLRDYIDCYLKEIQAVSRSRCCNLIILI